MRKIDLVRNNMDDTPLMGGATTKSGTLGNLKSIDDRGTSRNATHLSCPFLTSLLPIVGSHSSAATGLDNYRSNLKRVSHARRKENQSGKLLRLPS